MRLLEKMPRSLLLLLAMSSPACCWLIVPARAGRMQPASLLCSRLSPVMAEEQQDEEPAAADAPPAASTASWQDKQLSAEKLLKISDMNDEMQALMIVALERLDRMRVASGKPKYENIDGMINSYVEETASRGMSWTRQEAESEVVRYLSRQALADEGGLDGDAQDNVNFVFLGVALLLAGYAAATIFTGGGDVGPSEVVEPVKFW